MNIETFVVGYVQTNCYVVYDKTGAAVIVDPGDEADKLLAFLNEKALKLNYIFLTHGHFDHIMAVAELKEATGAQVVIASGDAECLMKPEKSLSGNVRMNQRPVTADALAKDGDAFHAGEMKFTYLLTPGHTPGSAVILSGEAMFSGDTLFEDDCGRCDLPGGDYQEMLRSLRKLYALVGDYDVYPGHDVKTKLSRERIYNVNMREAVGSKA
jgi:glyoxylase-like metal-dependent hydrolase (beta-lactamase superfamily II)